VLHGYISPEVAVLMNPIHGDISNPRILKVTSDAAWVTDGVKRWTQGGCTVLAKVQVPEISLERKIAFALCAAPHPSIREFAIKWLSGEDRTYESAREATRVARNVWETAGASRKAWAADRAARAAWAAAEARARGAAWSVAEAAEAAAEAAEEAAECTAKDRFEARLPQIWERAEAILRGEYPAEKYDAPYEGEIV
jgi:hypothetical protein